MRGPARINSVIIRQAREVAWVTGATTTLILIHLHHTGQTSTQGPGGSHYPLRCYQPKIHSWCRASLVRRAAGSAITSTANLWAKYLQPQCLQRRRGRLPPPFTSDTNEPRLWGGGGRGGAWCVHQSRRTTATHPPTTHPRPLLSSIQRSPLRPCDTRMGLHYILPYSPPPPQCTRYRK